MNTKTLNSMKINGNSIISNDGKWVVVRTGKNTYRLGEQMGDWIMSGTASEVLARMSR